MIKYVLWDIDGTLLNFHIAEENAIKACFLEYGLGNITSEMLKDYRAINNKYWKALERGEVSRKDVLEGRFKDFFNKYNIDTKLAKDFNISYQKNLGKTYVFNDNAYETVMSLNGKYYQYAASNGSLIAQRGKLEGAGLDKIFKGVFISEQIGFEKPSTEFFDHVFEKIGSNNKSEYVIIGDSLTSDILGGNLSGIKTIWFNPDCLEANKDIHFDYEIKNLKEVLEILP